MLDGLVAEIIATVLSDIFGVDDWEGCRLLQIVQDTWNVWNIRLRRQACRKDQFIAENGDPSGTRDGNLQRPLLRGQSADGRDLRQ